MNWEQMYRAVREEVRTREASNRRNADNACCDYHYSGSSHTADSFEEFGEWMDRMESQTS